MAVRQGPIEGRVMSYRQIVAESGITSAAELSSAAQRLNRLDMLLLGSSSDSLQETLTVLQKIQAQLDGTVERGPLVDAAQQPRLVKPGEVAPPEAPAPAAPAPASPGDSSPAAR